MLFPIRREYLRLSVGTGLAVYALAIAIAGTVTVFAIHRVGALVLETLEPAPQAKRVLAAPPAVIARAVPAAATERPQSMRREAIMTPLNDRFERRWSFYRGGQFGSSSRSQAGPFGRLFGEDSDDRPLSDTFRTVCVRLCDGYYFPVSFSVTEERLAHDAQVCASRCGVQGRLFRHRNPGGSAEDMQDLQGRPYSKLQTAFLYRTQYVPSCTCQPHPWEAASLDRHRVYALAAAVRKGNKDAAKELQALQMKAKQTAQAPGQLPPDGVPVPQLAQNPARVGPDGETLMRLGADGAPKTGVAPIAQRPSAVRESDWKKRVFSPPN
jgi:hypothetical protein